MTIVQFAEAALKRAAFCEQRNKKASHHYSEAVLTTGYALALEMQKQGKSYKREVLNVLSRPTKGVRALWREKQGRLF
jgi:hypothetical protein